MTRHDTQETRFGRSMRVVVAAGLMLLHDLFALLLFLGLNTTSFSRYDILFWGMAVLCALLLWIGLLRRWRAYTQTRWLGVLCVCWFLGLSNLFG